MTSATTSAWKPGEATRGSRSGHGAIVGSIALFVGMVPLLLIAEFALWSDGAAEDAIGYFPGASLMAVPFLAIPALIIGALTGAALGVIPTTPNGARQAPVWLAVLGIPLTMVLATVADLPALLGGTPVICLTLWIAGRSWAKKTVDVSDGASGPFSHRWIVDPSRTTATTIKRSLWVGALHGVVGTVAFNLVWTAIDAVSVFADRGWWSWTSSLEHVFDTSLTTSPFSIAFGAAGGALLFWSKRIDLAPLAAAGLATAYLAWRMLDGGSLDGVLLTAGTLAIVAIAWYLGISFRSRVFERANRDELATTPAVAEF